MGNPKSSPAIRQKQAKANSTSFKPGQSGNPSGRPKLPEDVKHVRELARQYTQQAIDGLVETLLTGSSSAKVAAANALLDRGWGKAEQPLTGADGGNLKMELSAPWLERVAKERGLV